MSADRQGRRRDRTYRGRLLRAENHREQHARSGPPPGAVAAHPLAGGEPPEMVDSARSLAEMIDHLRSVGSFAFDSEFIGERSYEPRLCLVQIATTRRVFLVDPLAGVSLAGLWELLVCPTVEKIVLAGQQDFGPAVQHTGRAPANVMDAQIAAGLIGPEYPLSLSRLIGQFAGVELGKGLAFTHWDNRPLSPRQVFYAAMDVRYLPAARAAIGERLAELGRTAWAREECAAALGSASLYRPPPPSLYLRVRGRDRLDRRQLAVLRELAVLRDQLARREDLPARTLLSDGILIALARRPVRRLSDLDQIRGLPRPVELRYGRRILQATARALDLAEEQWPAAESIDEMAPRARVDGLLAAINEFCLARSVAPSLATSRKDLAAACRAAVNGRPEGDHRLFRGWRRELLGELLERLWGPG